MVGYDWSMLALILGVAIFSSWRGLLWQVANLGAFVIGGMLVYLYLGTATALVQLPAPWNKIAAGAGLYVIGALFTYVCANLCRRGLRQLGLQSLDRHLGFVWGLCEGTALALTITLLMTYASTDPNAPVRHSVSARLASEAASLARPYVSDRTVARFLAASEAIRSAASRRSPSRFTAPSATPGFLFWRP